PNQIEMLYKAIYDKPPKIYILTSTVAVYFDQYKKYILQEDTKISNGYIDKDCFSTNYKKYSYGKFHCEAFVKNQSQIPYVILRLPFVTGPEDFSFRLAYFINRIRKGKITLPDDAQNIQQVFSGDLPKVVMEILNNFGKFQNQTINITPNAISVLDYIKILAEAMN
ncbi:nAD dependent epimerase/dehydratase family protein, partial [Candidatus Magnetomorum sp. HK-1]